MSHPTPPARPGRARTDAGPAGDGTEPATMVPDAMKEFSAALSAERGTAVTDPRDRLTKVEREQQHRELLGFVLCQREGEELSGVVPRK